MSRIFQLPLGFVNAYAIQGDRSVWVDTGYPGMENRILLSLQRMGIDPQTLSLIFITHGPWGPLLGVALVRIGDFP